MSSTLRRSYLNMKHKQLRTYQATLYCNNNYNNCNYKTLLPKPSLLLNTTTTMTMTTTTTTTTTTSTTTSRPTTFAFCLRRVTLAYAGSPKVKTFWSCRSMNFQGSKITSNYTEKIIELHTWKIWTHAFQNINVVTLIIIIIIMSNKYENDMSVIKTSLQVLSVKHHPRPLQPSTQRPMKTA